MEGTKGIEIQQETLFTDGSTVLAEIAERGSLPSYHAVTR